MGGEPYEYFVPYQANVQLALDELRAQVFASGNYNGADLDPATAEEAFELAAAEGTCSILDIRRITADPDFCCAAPFSSDELRYYFGTDHPTHEEIRQGDEYWDDLERGQARYVVVYDGPQPSEIYFVGYSFDRADRWGGSDESLSVLRSNPRYPRSC